jgi:hypothetical protein
VIGGTTVAMSGVLRVAGDRAERRARAGAAGRVDLQAVSGDDLLRLWDDAVEQVLGVVPVLAHTVDELARHVQDKRTADPLFTQAGDPAADETEGQ